MNMKQFVIIISLVLISVASNAQDIITTNKGQRINATVREITPTLVRYNLYSNPDGKVIFLYKDMVSSILYQNGKIETFAVTDTEAGTQGEIEIPNLQNRERQSNTAIENSNSTQNRNLHANRSDNKIDYENGKFYLGTTQLTERELTQMYKGTPALSVYNQSIKMKKSGTWLIVGGSVLFIGGLIKLSGYVGWYSYTIPLQEICTAGVVIGSAAIVGGIYCKLKVVGSIKKKSASIYNQSLGKSNNDYSMNVGLLGNGIGFSVNF
jgi:hypothetical protein